MGVLLDDKRRIVALFWPNSIGSPGCRRVGEAEVTSIEVEKVNGQGAHVPWFIVREENGDYRRYNAAFVNCVEYANGVRDG